jgi:hypothetical protein
MSSSFHPRKETDCLNCGAEVKGRYCQDCGQPNREPVLKIGDLLGEFVHMFTHFDGKFFSTAKLLFTKPGFLSKAYLEGKRSRYLPPVQLYVFTSAIFFYLFYAFFVELPDQNELVKLDGQSANETPSTLNISFSDDSTLSRFSDVKSYEKYQDSLPEEKRDGWMEGYLNKQSLKINERFQKDQSGTVFSFIDDFIHSFPKLLIISLPFMALIMQLLYFRRKEISFVGHLVFVIHLYVFSFLATALNMVLKSIGDIKPLGFVHWIAMAVLVWIFYYGYKAMNNFYGGGRTITLIRYSTSHLLSTFVMIMLFIGYTVVRFLFV